MEKTGIIMLCLFLAVAGAACAHLPGGDWWQADTFPAPSLNPPPLANPILADREKVYVRSPVPQYTARAGLLYFRGPTPSLEAGEALARIFYRQFQEKRPFLEILLIPEPFSSVSEAVRQGRAHKVEAVVLGEVPYFLDSGGLGKTGLQVDLKVVEVKTGRLLWEISDSISASPRPIVDLWLTETRPRPAPSIYTLAERLAGRMAETLRERPSVAGFRHEVK